MEVRNKSKKKQGEIDLTAMVYGKVPPQSKELEKAVLGAILIDKNAFDRVYPILKAFHFYVNEHVVIYQACEKLNRRSEPVDLLTVAEAVHLEGSIEIIGGLHYLTSLTNSVVSSANIEAHATKIFQKWVQREVIRIAGEAVGNAYGETFEVSELLDRVQTELFSITKGLYKRDFTDMSANTNQALIDIDAKVNKTPGELTGVPTGFKDIDSLTGGLQETDLIALAARPAVGKTALALNIAMNAAKHPVQAVGVALFSLEMSTSQLVQRMLSAVSGVPLEKIRDGDLNEIEKKSLWQAANIVAEYPIYIDDTPNLNIIELKAKIKRLAEAAEKNRRQKKLKKGLGLIIIDYLQLMNGVNDGSNKSKNDIVSEISRELKVLAKEIKVPIVELSQMSRSIETRTEKEPQLSDLRESGAIEQDADIVMFLYRDEFETKLKVAKHRNGKLKHIKLKTNMEIQKFSDYVGESYSPRKKEINTGNFDEGIPPIEDEFSFINKK